MKPLRKNIQRVGLSAFIAVSTFVPGTVQASTALPDKPLFVGGGVPPLTMLTMARNHKLYYEAYDDASDINGDGEIDTNYKPEEIDYFGYFDSQRCYTYDSGDEVFQVSSKVANSDTKTCAGSSEWSGDFLNYLTTSRMDALRKTLYGGKRVVDTTDRTVLERAYIPQDAHSWGKEYSPEDGYDIADYTPLSALASSTDTSYSESQNGLTGFYCDRDNEPEDNVCNDPDVERLDGPIDFDSGVADWLPSGADSDGNNNEVNVVWTGQIEPATSDIYQIQTQSDDGVRVYIDGVRVIDNYTTHSVATDTSGPIPMTAGEGYDIRIEYFESTGDEVLKLEWIDSAGNTEIIPASELSPVAEEPVITGRHLFASTNAAGANDVDDSNPPKPLLRYVEDNSHRIWNWVSTERPVADDDLSNPNEDISAELVDRTVRVEVCTTPLDEDGDGVADDYEDFCQKYTDDGGNEVWKPTGLLHDFGETDRMKFGLMTGSYEKNYSGGVLRRTISSFSDEVDPDTGIYDTSVDGIVKTIDSLRTVRFNTSDTSNHQYECGFAFDEQRSEGECQNWGNPVAEMMYETLRYFSGSESPTQAFSPSSNSVGSDVLGLPSPDWDDPYASNDGEPECSRAFQLVLSDINPTFDSDQLPGSAFGSDPGQSDFNGNTLNVADEAQDIWNQETEEGAISSPVFVGETTGNPDGAPTAKTVSTFGNMRGLSPEEPTKEGSYYAGSVARFGKQNDINPADGSQYLDTFSVALSSPLPRIRVPVGDGDDERIVTLVPFAKSVASTADRDIDASEGAFQATDAIVDFYIERLENLEPGSDGPASAVFRINYEDSEMGTDYDMDAIVRYIVQETPGGDLSVTLESEYAAGDVIQHIGYVIQGTTQDGIYLEVRDEDTNTGDDIDYFLDTPPGQVPPSQTWNDNQELPLTASRTFTPGTTDSGSFPRDPLWYAAKYGGFIDSNDNLEPDVTEEWDEDGDGDPDNYFFVSNAGELGEQLTKAFEEILAVVGSASSVSVNSTQLDSTTVTYQATFNSENWEGDLQAFEFLNDGTGELESTPIWSAEEELPASTARNLYTTVDTDANDNVAVPFQWSNLTTAERETLTDAGVTEDVLEYIRGRQENEQSNGGTFRNRGALIGDIIDSSPEFVGQENFGYASLADGDPDTYDEGDKYRDYLDDKKGRERVVLVGANDGMLHAFNAGNYDTNSGTYDQGTGEEIFGYIPEAVHADLPALTDPNYEHEYYVNGSLFAGDAFIDVNNSGTTKWHTVVAGAFAHGHRGIFALDVAEADQGELTIDGASGDEAPMWEFTPENILNNGNIDNGVADELGHVLGEPQIVRLADGTYAAVFGNGYNSASGNATLFVVDLETGEPITDGVITTGTGGGLATPFIVDEDGDRNADYAYAGDLDGNMWRFNLDPTSNDFGIAYGNNNNPEPLFKAVGPDGVTPQPITSQPVVGIPPQGRNGVMVYFGTGKYFAVGDSTLPTDPQIQSVYGVHDDGGNQASDAARKNNGTVDGLVEQTITAQVEATVDGEDLRLRQISDNAVDYANTSTEGWYMDLAFQGAAEGEQVVSAPVLRFGRLSLTTFTPSEDPCEFGGRSWFMQVDAQSGSRLEESAIDVNNDGVIDEDDLVNLDGDDDGNPDPVSGRQLGGVIAQPVVINDSGQDRAIFSKLCNDQDCKKTETELTQGGGLSVGRQSWREVPW
jgi:type IV pilus assembly protein PilY1